MLGSALVKLLVANGAHDVRILRRSSSRLDLLGTVSDSIEHIEGDVLEPLSLLEAVAGIDAVFHLAAVVGFGEKGKDDPYAANYVGTANVVNAMLRAGSGRLVHTSSIAALGRRENQKEPVTESSEWARSRFNSQYALSKYRAELEVRRGIAEGLDAVIVNPSLIFGEGRPDENTSMVIDRVRKGRVPGIPVGGTNVVDVFDVARGHVLALQAGITGERYILGGQNLYWRDIFRMIADELGVPLTSRVLNPQWFIPLSYVVQAGSRALFQKPVITPETARITSRFYRYDITKAKRELGYEHIPFQETIARLVAHMGN